MTKEIEDAGITGVGQLLNGRYSIITLTNVSGELIVEITGDGNTVFGPGFKSVDQAARELWLAFGQYCINPKYQ